AQRITGVLSPVVTPFKADLAPDPERFVKQCKWLLSQNVGLAVFGTNSEANSISVDEKMVLLEKLVSAGVDPARMMPGTGHCAITKAFLDQFAKSGFDVFPGAETFLLQGMRNGGAGCISATANTNPAAIAHLYDMWQAKDADAQQAKLDEVRKTFAKYPMI